MHNSAMWDKATQQSGEHCRTPDVSGVHTPPPSASEFWRRSTGSARIMRYVSLLYSGFFVIQPYYEHDTGRWIWLGVVYAIFLALYFAIPNTVGRIQQMLLTQMFALAFTYFPFNQSASGLFVYPITILAFMTRSMRLYLTVLMLTITGILIETWVFHLQWWTGGMAIFFSVVVGFSNFEYSRTQRAAFQLNRANDEIEHLAQVAERERIARDLHDLLGHTLTVIAIKSELANRVLPSDPQRAAQEMSEVEQTARKALAEVREAVTGYRSEGLAAEIARARQTLLAANVQLTTSVEAVELTPALANILCLALREAVTNIVRHASASVATLQVNVVANRWCLQVQDNGVGVDSAEGNGLRGMRERVGKVGGTVDLRRASPAGTALTVWLPKTAESQTLEESNALDFRRLPMPWRAGQ